MLVQERNGDVAIVTNGGSGYLVVEIIGEAETYKEAKEIMDEVLEEDEGEDEEEEEDSGEEDEE